jgi:hypothetical protein
MRIPGSVLDRVRGAVVVAALTSACGAEPPTPPPPIAAPPPAVIVPVPIDPVAYSITAEDARLTRTEAADLATTTTRQERIDAIAEARRAAVARNARQRAPWMNDPIMAMCGRG